MRLYTSIGMTLARHAKKLAFSAATGSSPRSMTSAGANQYAIISGNAMQRAHQRRQQRAESERRERGEGRLGRIAGHEDADTAHPDGPDRDDEHDKQYDHRAGEIEEAEDEERGEAVGKAAEEVVDRQLAAAILRPASGHDPGRENGREDRRRDAAEQRNEVEADDDHEEDDGDRDPHPRRQREQAPASLHQATPLPDAHRCRARGRRRGRSGTRSGIGLRRRRIDHGASGGRRLTRATVARQAVRLRRHARAGSVTQTQGLLSPPASPYD